MNMRVHQNNKRLWTIFLFIFFSLFTVTALPTDRANELVYFNVSNLKVHKLTCVWGQRCTKNCITIPRAKAYSRGGIPCKVCGG